MVLEQDAAYWEVHVEQLQLPSETTVKESKKCNAMFGVATKKDRQFYNTLEELPEGEGTHSLILRMRRVQAAFVFR